MLIAAMTSASPRCGRPYETTIAPLVECPTATGESFWGAWTDLAASYAWRGQKAEAAAAVVELLKVRPFRKEFQRIVEGARTAGLPER